MGDVIEFRPRQALEAEDPVVYFHPVMGDSMMPTARPGDVWVYREADRFEGAGVYILTDGIAGPMVKRLEPVPGGNPGLIRIRSDNPLYGPQDVPLRGLEIIGQVVAVMALG